MFAVSSSDDAPRYIVVVLEFSALPLKRSTAAKPNFIAFAHSPNGAVGVSPNSDSGLRCASQQGAATSTVAASAVH